jgi:hypothetical protein
VAQYKVETGALDPKISSHYEVVMLANGANGTIISRSNPLPVSLGADTITITGNTFIVDTVNVASSPENPIHNHITQVGTGGLLEVPYLPVGGNVNIVTMPEVEIKNDTGNPIPVSGTVELSNTTINALGILFESLNIGGPVDRLIAGSNSAILTPDGILTVPGNILPSVNGAFTLGDATHKWADVWIGPNTLNIQDVVTGNNAQITVESGVLKIDGANQLQVGQLKFVDNTIESLTGNVDIQIGLTDSTANLILNRNVVTAAGKTIGLEDVSDGKIATLSAANGYVVIAGNAAGLIVGSVEIFNNTVESTRGNVNLILGNTIATANLVLSRNTVMSEGKNFITTGNVTVGNLTVTGTTNLSTNVTPTYGQFWSNTTQTVVANDTEYQFVFNNTNGHNNVQLGSGSANSRVIISQTGLYNIQFSAQIDKASGGGTTSTAYIWFKKNGQAIVDSAGFFALDNAIQAVQTWNILTEVTTPGDYYEISYAASATNFSFPTIAGNPAIGYPASPSIIVTVTPIGI